MSFNAPWYLLMLLLVPVAVWWLGRLERARHTTALQYADENLLGDVLKPGAQSHSRWPRALQLIALGALLLTAARPNATLPLPQNKAAIVIALDTSRSMLATDVQENRLAVAKAIVKRFLQLAPADTKIGLVTFSESAASVVPITTDRQLLLQRLEKLNPGNGTSLADPLVAGVRALPGRKDAKIPDELLGRRNATPTPNTTPTTPPIDLNALPPGAILMLSDGVSNTRSNPTAAAKFAKDYKVKVYTVAIGKEGGAVSRIGGQDYFIPFDAKSLAQLAQDTDGKALTPDDKNLDQIFKELGTVIRLEPTKLELGGGLSGLAVLMLGIAGIMSLRWNRRMP